MKENIVLKNAKWIIICKIAQSLLQLVIGMLSARYLGPANYGLINYAASIVAFAVPITHLGLNATLVQELIDSPEKEGQIMGTSMCMSFIASIFCIFMVSAVVSAANRDEQQTLLVCVLYSLSLLFQAMELIQYWFHSKLQSKYPSLMMLAAYVIVSAYKICLLIFQKSIYWFAIVHVIEYGVVAVSLLTIYHKQKNQGLSVSWNMAKKLFSRSRYYILASMMVTVFQNTDHIMLKMISGDIENGFYSAAITCTSVCQFLYTAVIDSARPVIIRCKKTDSVAYEKNISRLYCIVTYMAAIQGVAFFIFADIIVYILYGEDYLSAIPVLRILVWYVSFSFMGSVRNVWILAEGRQSILWKLNLTGALINFVINYLLIPVWGASGAAFASLLTQFSANFVLGFIIRSLRPNNRLLLNGIHPKFMWETCKEFMAKKSG